MLPALVLIGVFGIRTLITLKPEAIPIKVPLNAREASLRMIRLMLFLGVIIHFDRFREMLESARDFETNSQDGGDITRDIIAVAVPHFFHEQRSMHTVEIERNGIFYPITKS